MNKKTPILFLLFSILTFSTLWGQTTVKHNLSVRAGYANMLGGTAGLTNSSNSYERELCSGFSWDAQYNYLTSSKVGLGMLYSGYTASGKLTYSSDHIYTHYLAPQFALIVYQKKQFKLQANAGLGYIFYLNNSTVFGKDRKVTGGNLAANIGVAAEYRINNRWGVSLGTQYVESSLKEINTFYHGENIKVKLGDGGNQLNLSRLNISAGVNFYF